MKRLSPREQRRLLERMGLSLKDIEGVEEVQIKLRDKIITIKNPVVQVLEVKGSGKIYQISGVEEESPLTAAPSSQQPEVSEEDIDLIVAQTGATREEAKKALIESGGDIAKAILSLRSSKV
ncbi:MAG: nascent polypeptide-associated complex protein [Infirmifilum sp.]|jgi:nascent polypeptide-associated complex subunit alpha|uniref:nascent polypeptide-associated complex protein n=1 Tax=Infirmifilum TaxID=2856573 RepID=UPI0023565A61